VSSHENKELRRRFWAEAFGDIDAIVDEHIASEWLDHDRAPDQPAGAAGYKWLLGRLKTSFPDIRFTEAELIAEGDKVATMWTLEGTDTEGYRDQPPTGRRIKVSGIQIDRLANGKVVESWNHSSSDRIATQLASGSA
jgi:predicted ester cyclase